MLHSTFLATIAAVVALAPLHAETATLPGWVDTVHQKVQRVLELNRDRTPVGTATVTFQRGPNGRAVAIESRHATSMEAGEAARRIVRQLTDLPPLPAGIAADTRLALKMLVGDEAKPVQYGAAYAKLMGSANATNDQIAARMANNQLASNVPN